MKVSAKDVRPRVFLYLSEKRVARILEYVRSRRNPDGGYTFCQDADSNAQDTYFALAIFDLLGSDIPLREGTVEWLRRFPADNVYSCFYVTKGLILAGERPPKGIGDRILELRKSHGGFGSLDIGVETREFDSTYRAAEILRELGVHFDGEPTRKWLLSCLNPDGGFGAIGYSDLISTFHAVSSLRSLNHDVSELMSTLGFVRSCERREGGFTSTPQVTLPYIQETYAGVSLIGLMGRSCSYPEATRRFILRLQNANGGFRRSLELGISTFEYTFHALRTLQGLAEQNNLGAPIA